MPIADAYPSAIKAVTLLGRAVIRGDNSRVGEYSYTRVLPDGFLLKSIVFTVCEHDYMNIPTPLSRLVTALLSGNALFEFSMKRREILKTEVAGRYKSLRRDSHRLLPGCLVTSYRKVFEILHKLNVCLLSNFATNGSLTVPAHLPGRGLIAILVL